MSRERNRARAAILDAARLIAARDGVEALSLSGVADETGFARGTVYGYFAGKNDLIHAVAAEALGELARRMQGIDWPCTPEPEPAPEPVPEPESVVVALPRPPEPASEILHPQEIAAHASAQTPEPVLEIVPAQEVAAPEPVREIKLARHTLVAEVLREKEKEDAAPPGEAEKIFKPDAWLERRLRVFEHALNGSDARHDQAVQAHRAVACKVEEDLKQFAARADASEQRQRAAFAELRALQSEAALRLQTLEAVIRTTLREDAPAPIEVALPECPVEEPREIVEPARETAPSGAFLSAARRTAIEAAAAAEIQKAHDAQRRSARSRKLLIGLLVIAVILCAAGAASKEGFFPAAHSQTPQMAKRAVVARPAYAAPRDALLAAANRGDAMAQLRIALRYLRGEGTAKNDRAAAIWLARAAEHGQPVAQYLLATLYRGGTGIARDAARAYRWYEASALQGNRKAMHDLALAYADGDGAPKNPAEAARWFSRAASFGYVDSQFDLAVLYERGDGVPQSLLDAYKWYAVASAQGDHESAARIEALRAQMRPDDLTAAEQAAAQFAPLPCDPAANTVPAAGG